METIGKIQRIKNDRKSVSLGYDNWYNSFKPISEDFKVGDSVKIVYTTKDVDDKTFKNLKSMVKIKDEEQCKPIVIFKKEDSNNEKLISKQLTNQTENSILMIVKDILVSEVNNGYKFDKESFESKAKELTKLFKEIYYSL